MFSGRLNPVVFSKVDNQEAYLPWAITLSTDLDADFIKQGFFRSIFVEENPVFNADFPW